MTVHDPPPPLDEDARALLLAYRQRREVPDLVKMRVRRRLAADVSRRQNLWAGVLLAAAAALLIAYRVGLELGWVVGPEVREAASFTREADEERSLTTRPKGQPGAKGRPEEVVSPADAPHEEGQKTLSGAPSSATPAVVGPGKAKPRTREPASLGEREASTLDLAGERKLLEEAWRALTLGDPTRALATTRAHRDAYPNGLLGQERDAIAVIAGCKAGLPEAAADTARFADQHPQSPWLPQIRAACPG